MAWRLCSYASHHPDQFPPRSPSQYVCVSTSKKMAIHPASQLHRWMKMHGHTGRQSFHLSPALHCPASLHTETASLLVLPCWLRIASADECTSHHIHAASPYQCVCVVCIVPAAGHLHYSRWQIHLRLRVCVRLHSFNHRSTGRYVPRVPLFRPADRPPDPPRHSSKLCSGLESALGVSLNGSLSCLLYSW